MDRSISDNMCLPVLIKLELPSNDGHIVKVHLLISGSNTDLILGKCLTS